MVFSAQYANRYAAYGNIQYGRYSPPILPVTTQEYGAWPEEEPKQAGMLYSDWQDPVDPSPSPVDPAIAENIEIIKRLRTRLAETQDAFHRAELRRQIEVAQLAKSDAFKRAARIDEEETLFILLH